MKSFQQADLVMCRLGRLGLIVKIEQSDDLFPIVVLLEGIIRHFRPDDLNLLSCE